MKKFENLKVWQNSVHLIRIVYVLCKSLPYSETNNLIDQLKRATVSISLNIAEGSGSQNDKEFRRYLIISKKSAAEVTCILLILQSLYKTEIHYCLSKTEEIIKMLNGLIKKLETADCY